MTARNLYRKTLNNVMLTLTGVCAFVTVSTLFVILAYLVYNGGKSVNLDFFTKLASGTGETGRRHGQRDRGQRRDHLFASLIGIPIGFFTGRLSLRMGRPLGFRLSCATCAIC
jgi:ABC-type phosphate transport system permease subunit